MGEIIGHRWEIQRSLGEGGQARTFIVRDTKGDGEILYVAKLIKNIHRISRFKREIEAVRTLSHPNIVSLIDFDLDAERPFLIMEYCSGKSLAQADAFWIGFPEICFRIFIEICEGVFAAHNAGIIHRDLKPQNIFLRTPQGPAVVGDFGICFIDDDGTRLTLTEEAVGPRLFMAPELEDGRVEIISAKSDTYSLGKVLYWLLSGGKVFSREKHRDLEWDLKIRAEESILGWRNIYMEHANRLLDLMITSEPETRRSIRNIMILSSTTSKLIEHRFTPLDPNIPQPCTYCGQGRYVLKAANLTDVRNFGFNTVGSPDWRILGCNECGHVQIFRVDIAGQNDWWRS